MENSSSRKQKWVLTQEAFDSLLAHLDPDRDAAGEMFEKTRRKLVRYFEWRNCLDPEALADETFNRASRKLIEGQEVANVEGFCYGIAGNIFNEELKKRKKEREAIERAPRHIEPEDPFRSEARLKCFELCLADLPEESRDLITSYYKEDKHAKIENRKRLAENLGIASNALRIRTHRIRDRLEQCVIKCLKGLPTE